MAFMMRLIGTKNVKAVEMALLALFEKNKELRELFEPIHIAVEIVITPSTNHSQKIIISLSNLSKHHFLLPPLKTTIFNCV